MGKMFRVIIALVVLTGGCMLNPQDIPFTADIDGNPFKATFASWSEDGSSSSITAFDIQILKPANSKGFIISVMGAFEEGSYTLGLEDLGNFALYNDFSQEKVYVTESGTLTITSKTEDGLTGTFDMILVETLPLPGGSTLQVTNGEFDLPSSSPVPEI